MLWFPHVKGKNQTLAQIGTPSVKQTGRWFSHSPLEPKENSDTVHATAHDSADIQPRHVGNHRSTRPILLLPLQPADVNWTQLSPPGLASWSRPLYKVQLSCTQLSCVFRQPRNTSSYRCMHVFSVTARLRWVEWLAISLRRTAILSKVAP